MDGGADLPTLESIVPQVGDILFILVDIDGAKTWTPSDEGNPATAYVSQYIALFDKS